MSILQELTKPSSAPACKICAYLETLDTDLAVEWDEALSKPVSVVGNVAVQTALRKRGVLVEETSVRRHRRNHCSS